MKRIEIEIEGVTPLLMNSPKGMLEPQDAVTLKTKKRDPIIEAEKVAYRTNKGELYVPAAAVKGSMIKASAQMRSGKFSVGPLIAGGVRIEPFEILLGIKKYEIDLRTVVVQRSRIVKARPRIDKWKIKFDLIYDENLLPDTDALRKILEDAGSRVGILDFSPRCKGEMGCFRVTKFMPTKKSIKKSNK